MNGYFRGKTPCVDVGVAVKEEGPSPLGVHFLCQRVQELNVGQHLQIALLIPQKCQQHTDMHNPL